MSSDRHSLLEGLFPTGVKLCLMKLLHCDANNVTLPNEAPAEKLLSQ